MDFFDDEYVERIEGDYTLAELIDKLEKNEDSPIEHLTSGRPPLTIYRCNIPRFMDLPVDVAVTQLEAVSRQYSQQGVIIKTGKIFPRPRKAAKNNGAIYFNAFFNNGKYLYFSWSR